MMARLVRLAAGRRVWGTLGRAVTWMAFGSLWAMPGLTAELPFMIGSWEGIATEISGEQRIQSPFRLEIVRQEEALLWGYEVRRIKDPTGAITPSQLPGARLLGSLNPDGSGGVLAKDNARMSFRLVDRNRMEVEYAAIGRDDWGAFMAVLHRSSGESASGDKPAYPDLAGSWQGAYRYPGAEAAIDDSFQLDLVKQEAESIWMDDVWHPLDPATGQPGAEVVKDRVVGTFGPGGRHGVLAKPDVWYAFRLLDENRLFVQFTRLGGTLEQAMAFNCVLRRDGESEPAFTNEWPVLTGAWEGSVRYPQLQDTRIGKLRIELTKQDGAQLWGENKWIPLDPETGQPGTGFEQVPLRGSLLPNGKSGRLAQPGIEVSFQVMSSDRLQVEVVRLHSGASPSTAFYGILEREP